MATGSLIIVTCFLILLLIGVPIVYSLGTTSLIAMVFLFSTPLSTLPEVLFNNLIPFPLLAIPFFVIAANIMTSGGIAKALVNFSESWLGHLPGGMGIVSLAACAIFSAISGSSIAAALAIGSIVIPAMIEQGYDKKFAMGLVAAGGTLGILIPPSIPMIMYGFIGNVSTGKLFIAAIVPSLVVFSMLVIIAVFISIRNEYKSSEKVSWSKRFKVSLHSFPAILMPVIILGGIYSGVFTPTESSIVAVIYSLIVSLFIYKELPLSRLIMEIGKSMKYAGMLMIILASAMVFGHVLTSAQIPQSIVQFVLSINLNEWSFIVIICLILIILGFFMEVTSILMITAPILIPIVNTLGIDPIHFGVIFIITMEIGLITPPIGLNLFVVSSVGKAPVSEAIRGVTPFTIGLFLIIWIVAFIPIISLWLPAFMD